MSTNRNAKFFRTSVFNDEVTFSELSDFSKQRRLAFDLPQDATISDFGAVPVEFSRDGQPTDEIKAVVRYSFDEKSGKFSFLKFYDLTGCDGATVFRMFTERPFIPNVVRKAA